MTKFKDLKVGECLSESHFYHVEKIVGKEVELKNAAGESIVVDDKYVDSCIISASQFDKEEKITKTDAAALLISSANVAMTVSFNKKVDEKQVIEETVTEVEGSSIANIRKAITKAIKKSINGEERIMVGHHSGTTNEFGRLGFTDMEVTTGHNLRQVDPRELNFMVIKGVKYVVK